MFKVVFDTNVLISAILFGGSPRKCLELAIEGEIELYISKEIISEIEGVLAREKFNIAEENIRYIISSLDSIAELVSPKIKLDIIKKDPQDNTLLECAIESEADFIISGDAHLLELSEFRKIKILKPADFLKQYC
ncbi:putative toxin-antitoxin system toxin component, PIN family [candidate division WOR-3 bacterium]|nr:putative toxin-antitoxin system toxin component, PIN family [candidate division WOR-3 bacterium]